jgi:hypothetical protein
MKAEIQQTLSTPAQFQLRKTKFIKRGVLPMFALIIIGCVFLTIALKQKYEYFALAGYLLIFASGVIFVLTAKKYYRCPVCDKVVVPTKDDGKPSEISFAIAYNPDVCPYCRAALK